MHIDIEIDEPYTFDGKPIHTIGSDYNRNDYFRKKGWIVIRFAEEQVVKHPISCCKKIAQTISKITYNDEILKKYDNVSDLELINMWSREDAVKMYLNSYRSTYL